MVGWLGWVGWAGGRAVLPQGRSIPAPLPSLHKLLPHAAALLYVLGCPLWCVCGGGMGWAEVAVVGWLS